MRKSIYGMICIALLSACSGSKSVENEKTTNHSKMFESKIKLIKPKAEQPVREITFTGKVETNPELTTAYTPFISGVIERSYFHLGDRVQKGQPLLEIRSAELSALQAELIALESELEVCKRELNSAEELYNDKLLSESELLQKRGEARQAQPFSQILSDGFVVIFKTQISNQYIQRKNSQCDLPSCCKSKQLMLYQPSIKQVHNRIMYSI